MLGVGNLRPAKAIYPARDFLLPSGPRPFFNDRYAAIKRRNDSHLQAKTFFVVFATDSSKKRPEFLAKNFFWTLPSIRPKKGLHFWRRPFSFGPLEWYRPAGTFLGLNVAHKFERLPTTAIRNYNSCYTLKNMLCTIKFMKFYFGIFNL